jgi:hypothetical protein
VGRPRALLENMHAADTQGGLNDGLPELEHSRHQGLLAIFEAGMNDGMCSVLFANVWDSLENSPRG